MCCTDVRACWDVRASEEWSRMFDSWDGARCSHTASRLSCTLIRGYSACTINVECEASRSNSWPWIIQTGSISEFHATMDQCGTWSHTDHTL